MLLVYHLILWLALIGLALIISLMLPKIVRIYLQVKNSTAFSKPLPLENLDQSGNFLKQNFLFYTYRLLKLKHFQKAHRTVDNQSI